jgi:hypothetical protein
MRLRKKLKKKKRVREEEEDEDDGSEQTSFITKGRFACSNLEYDKWKTWRWNREAAVVQEQREPIGWHELPYGHPCTKVLQLCPHRRSKAPLTRSTFPCRVKGAAFTSPEEWNEYLEQIAGRVKIAAYPRKKRSSVARHAQEAHEAERKSTPSKSRTPRVKFLLGGGGKSKKFYKIKVWRNSTGWRANKTTKGRRELWVAISPGYIYLSYEKGRAYWVLKNMQPRERPRLTFDAASQVMHVNSFRIQFERPRDFLYAREALENFSP